MIEATISFSPTQVNGARKGGFGVWRIVRCDEFYDGLIEIKPRIRVEPWYKEVPGQDPVEIKVLKMPVERPYIRGTIVNPRRLLMEYLHPLIYFTAKGL
jgi:hypothetical protein